MLHEIVNAEDEEWVNEGHFNNIDEGEQDDSLPKKKKQNQEAESDILEPNQILQVVKITKCKMR